MTHVLPVIVAGVPEKLDNFETAYLDLRISTRFPNQSGHIMQPNMRNICFFRITVPADCEDAFLEDFKPYLGGTGAPIKQRLYFLRDLVGKLFKLEPVAQKQGMSPLKDGWVSSINRLILGKNYE